MSSSISGHAAADPSNTQWLYYRWSKEFLEAGKKRLAGDTARAATTDEVKELRREANALKEVVAELTLENRLLKPRLRRTSGWSYINPLADRGRAIHSGTTGTP